MSQFLRAPPSRSTLGEMRSSTRRVRRFTTPCTTLQVRHEHVSRVTWISSVKWSTSQRVDAYRYELVMAVHLAATKGAGEQ